MLKPSQIAAYEREITKLREELLKEIGHLEERKEEAVRAAASCSADHFQNLQDQFFSEYANLINACRQISFRKFLFLETFTKATIGNYGEGVSIFLSRLAEASHSTPSHFTLHEDRLRQPEEPSSKLLRLLWQCHQ